MQEAYRPPCSKSLAVGGGGGGCYLPWLGGTYLGQGVSTLGRAGTYLGRGVPILARGVPTLAGGRGYLPWLGGTYLEGGYLPRPRWVPPRCGQTNKLKLLASSYGCGW